jgi:hypothetical protein
MPEFGYPKPLLGGFAAKMQDRSLLSVRGTFRGRQNAAISSPMAKKNHQNGYLRLNLI